MPVPQNQIAPLTSLRFIAAFWVLLFHTAPPTLRAAAPVLIELGYCSVSFFFLLSGFVLALAYLGRPKPVDKCDFWMARFARIYPLFFITICADVPFLFAARLHKYATTMAAFKTVLTFFATAFMLKAWWPQRFMGLDDPNWSLSVEVFLYCIFPFVTGYLWRQTIACSLALLFVFYLAGGLLAGSAIEMNLDARVSLYNPLLHVAGFMQGILLAKLYKACNKSSHRQNRLRSFSGAMVVLSVALILLVARLQATLPRAFFHDGGFLPAFALIMLAFSSGSIWIDRAFGGRLLILLGEASYGLYLWHIVLWHYCGHLIEQRGGWISYIAYVVAAIVVSIFSFYSIERPARTWILSKYTDLRRIALVMGAAQRINPVSVK